MPPGAVRDTSALRSADGPRCSSWRLTTQPEPSFGRSCGKSPRVGAARAQQRTSRPCLALAPFGGKINASGATFPTGFQVEGVARRWRPLARSDPAALFPGALRAGGFAVLVTALSCSSGLQSAAAREFRPRPGSASTLTLVIAAFHVDAGAAPTCASESGPRTGIGCQAAGSLAAEPALQQSWPHRRFQLNDGALHAFFAPLPGRFMLAAAVAPLTIAVAPSGATGILPSS